MRYAVINTDNQYAEHLATGKNHAAYSTNYVLENSSCYSSLDEAITRVNAYADYELSMQTDPIILKHKTLKGVYGALGYWSDTYYGRVTDPASRPDTNAPPLDKHYIVNLIIEETSPWFNCAPGDNTPIGEIFTNLDIQIGRSSGGDEYDVYTEHAGKVLLNKNNYYTP
jgi:hypothetical protein